MTFLFSIELCYPQSPVYKNYTVNDGLPSQVVYCALQDNQGYMWFGTDAGVSRFDGRQFQNYTSKDGLSDNEVLKVFQDSNGRVWFLMLNGTLSYFLNGKIYSGLNDEKLSNIYTRWELMSFLEDSDHNLWFGSTGKELIFISNRGEAEVLHLDTLGNSNPKGLVFAFQNKEQVLLLVASAIYKVSKFHFSILDTSCYVSKKTQFIDVQNIDSTRAVATFNDGIRIIQDAKSKLIISKNDIPDYELVSRIYVDIDEGIWLFTSNFRTLFFKKMNNEYKLRYSYLPDMYVGAVAFDNEGNKWFCTIGEGILKLQKNAEQIKIFQLNSTYDKKEIWSVNLDGNNNIWFGSGTRNLYCIKGDSISHTINLGNREVPEGRITRIDFDKFNNIWCSISNGVVQIKNTSGNYTSVSKVRTEANLIYYGSKYFRFDKFFNPYFSSTWGVRKIFDVNGDYIHKRYIPEELDPPGRVFCLYFDEKNCLWYEKFNTLVSYDGLHLNKYSTLANEFKSQITSIEGAPDSVLVISTYGNGVHFFKNGKIINHVTTTHGLAGNLCRKVFVDSSTIYIATNQGFSHFSYKNNLISDIKTITTSDGILSNDIKDICARGDKIYLATSAGLCIVNKNISQSKAAAPPVYITSVSGSDSSIKEFQSLRFPYHADFSVNYIAITFEQPDKVTYQYNLSGHEKDWVETKNTSIAFSSLSPGDYKFLLRAKKYNSTWSNPVAINFSITPPFWQQWWFRLLFFSMFAGATYYLLQIIAARRYRIQLQALKEKQALADERGRISSDMHDDLGADLSNLLLLTRITGHNQNLREEEKNQLKKLELFATGLVKKVDEIIWALNPSNDTLKGLIHFIHDYTKNIAQLSPAQVSVTIPEVIQVVSISAIFRRNIFLVVKEALNNIIRHSNATHMIVAIKLQDNYLEILIKDNGSGFDLSNRRSLGNGLNNMGRRIEELKGKFNIESNAAGSTILFAVPFT